MARRPVAFALLLLTAAASAPAAIAHFYFHRPRTALAILCLPTFLVLANLLLFRSPTPPPTD